MPTMQRLKEIREARGLSQVELAERAGVDQATISRLERGNDEVTPHLRRRVAEALGVTLAELFTEDRDPQETAFLKALQMTRRAFRWAIAAGVAVVVLTAWMLRYDVQSGGDLVRIRFDRWTGEIEVCRPARPVYRCGS